MKEHRVIREIRRLAAENPDFVYGIPSKPDEYGYPVQGDNCLYVHDGKGSCGVGQALVKFGVLDPNRPFGKHGEQIEGVEASKVFEILGLRVPGMQKRWADNFQSHQDEGKTWGQAVAWADAGVYGG